MDFQLLGDKNFKCDTYEEEEKNFTFFCSSNST